MAEPLPGDVLVSSAGFWTRCALAVASNDSDAGMELLREMHLAEGKIHLSIVPGTRAREPHVAAGGFVGRPMQSRFPGVCAVCSKPFSAGSPILYDGDSKRAAHEACGGAE
jgi:hypothetical protein